MSDDINPAAKLRTLSGAPNALAGLALGVIVIGWEWNHRSATKHILARMDTNHG